MRFLITLSLFSAVAFSNPLHLDPKCQDVTYACQDLRKARDCGVLKECITDVWSTLGVPEDNNEICDICKEMVKEARDQLLSNQTQEEIKEVFEGSCKLLPIKVVAEACIKLVDEFIPELIEMLASRMDPSMVCTVAGLCFGEKGSFVYPKDGCEKCMDMTEALKKFVSLLPKDIIEEKLIDRCTTDTMDRECPVMIKRDLAVLFDTVDKLVPRPSCAMIGFCDGDFEQPLVNLGDNLTCEFCETLVSYLRSILSSKSLKEEIKTALHNLCSEFGSFAQECQMMVDDRFDEYYDLLIKELDPQKVCSGLGLCTQGQSFSMANPRIKAFPEFLPFHRFDLPLSDDDVVDNGIPDDEILPKDDLECEICKKVIEYVKETVQDPKKEEEIRQALDKACSYLPSSYAQKCVKFVDEYSEIIITLLSQDIDPDQICQYLSLCPPSSPQPSQTPKVENIKGIECDLCERIVDYVKGELVDPTSEAEIRAALDKVCSILPSRYSDKCKQLVSAYADMFVQLIVQQIDSKSICIILGLCTPAESVVEVYHAPPQNAKVKSADSCEICQLVVEELDRLLQDQAIDKEISKVIEKVCSVLPKAYEEQCRDIVESYTPYILQMLAQMADSKEICQDISLCSAPSGGQHKIRKGPLLGSVRCTWGPTYWCSSPENAKACHAVSFCQTKVWANEQK